jgi:uncharacterized protein
MAFLGVDCAPGTSVRQRVPVGDYSDGNPVLLPVAMIRGRDDGPTLVVEGAIDGDEVTGTEIARRVLETVSASEVAGTLIVIPTCNPPAFLTRTRTFALEERVGANVSNMIPGWPGGLLSERIASTLYTEFMEPADLTIDLHSAIDGCDIGSFTYILPDHGDGTYEERKRLGLGFGSPYTYRVDKIAAADLSQQPLSIRSIAEGYPRGATGTKILIAESGESRRVSYEYVDIGVRGVRRTMQALGMLAGDPAPLPAPREFTRVVPIHVDRGGGLRREARIGDEVRQGQRLATIVDMFGEVVEEVVSPIDGFVLRMMVLANVGTGAEAFWVVN